MKHIAADDYQTNNETEYTNQTTSPQVRAAKRAQARRDELDAMLNRATFLAEPDSALLRAVFERGQTTRDLARLLGESHMRLCRRVGKLRRRVASRRFTFFINQLATFDDTTAALVKRCLLHGESTRRVAADLGISYSRARKTREAVELLADLNLDAARARRA